MRLRRALGAVGVLLALVTGCDTPPAAAPPSTTADLRCPPATTTTTARVTTTVAPTTVVTTTTAKPSGPTLSRQQLIDAISQPGTTAVLGTTNPDLLNPRYSEPSAGSQTWRLTPGTVETRNSDGTLMAGVGPWVEVSSADRVNTGAQVNITGHLYSRSKATGQWTERTAWGGSLGWARHAFSWGIEHGTFGEGVGTAGWGSVDQTGVRFGQDDGDPQAPRGQGFVRVHGWPMSWTGLNGFFWTSVDPNSPTSLADRAKVDDVAAIVHVLEVRVVGTPAQIAASRFVVASGWDTYWQGADVVHPVDRTGNGSGMRAIAPSSTPTLVVTSTMSRAQIIAWPLTAYPGWVG